MVESHQHSGILTCSCNLFRDTSECGHVLACHVHLDTGSVPQLVPCIVKKALAGRGRGRARGRGRGRSAGWHDPDAPDEDAPEPAAAPSVGPSFPQAFVVPVNLREILAAKLFAATDASKRCSLAVLLAQRDRQQKLVAVLMADHITQADHAFLSQHGRQQVAKFLFENAELMVVGAMFSVGGAVRTAHIRQVMELRTVEQLAGHSDVLMGVMWRQGVEPTGGQQFYALRTDRPSVQPDPSRHEALDFVVPRHICEEKYRIQIVIVGAALHAPAQASSASAALPLDQGAPSLKLARAADIWNFLQTEAVEKSSKTLPVAAWLDRAPMAAGIRTLKDGQEQIREALEALAAHQRLRVQRGRSDRWDISSWIVHLV